MLRFAQDGVNQVPDHIYFPRGMLVPSEHYVLCLIARDPSSGKGGVDV